MDKLSRASEGDDKCVGNPDRKEDATALSQILSSMSINTSTIALPTSPASRNSQRQPNAGGSPARALDSYRRISGTTRRSSGRISTAAQPKSPHPLRKTSGKINIASQTKRHENEGTQRTLHEKSEDLSLASSTMISSHIPNDNRPTTAETIAEGYFRQELLRHGTMDVAASDTIVIIHDACYGHRYSRRKVTKSILSCIVERPERIQAGVLGISCAYVRLGERYAGGKHPPQLSSGPSPNIPFKIRRTNRSVSLDSPVVVNVHGSKWMKELATMCGLAESRLLSGEGELARPRISDEEPPKQELHTGDLYLCRESLGAFEGALGGVLDAVDEVFRSRPTHGSIGEGCKKAFVCIRPPGHHCSADMPSGFCWINNVHVGIEHAAQTHGLTHAAIIDFDLHHGDGSQTITWERNERAVKLPKGTPAAKRTSIGYFSVHDINSYPCEDGVVDKVQNASLCIENAHGQSIWNVHLQPWKTEAEFWELYTDRYIVLLDKARAFLRAQTQRLRVSSANGLPKAAIFISAGFDASEYEGEGMQRHKVNVPTEFYARFTADITKLAEEEGTSVEGRIISVLEGGYSQRALASGVLSHIAGLVGHKVDEITNKPVSADARSTATFPNEWWNVEAMASLETVVNPMTPQAGAKKARLSEPTFHATPTESFLAKVVDATKVHRAPPPVVRSVEVEWATATHELSKLLIPMDRQINSFRHDELAEPRVKKDRQSIMVLPSAESAVDRMQTRGRKPKSTEQLRTNTSNDIPLPIRTIPRQSRMSTNSDMSVTGGDASNVSHANVLQPLPPVQATKTTKPRVQVGKVSNGVEDRRKTLKPPIPSQKIHRTRRVSSVPQDFLQNEAAMDEQTSPPAKAGAAVITAQRTNKPDHDSAARVSQIKDDEVEKLTSGIKRITLRLPPKESAKPKKSTVVVGTVNTIGVQNSQTSKSPRNIKTEAAGSQIPREITPSDPMKAESIQASPGVVVGSQVKVENMISTIPLAVTSEDNVAPNFNFENPEPAFTNVTSSCDTIMAPTSSEPCRNIDLDSNFGSAEVGTATDASPENPQTMAIDPPNACEVQLVRPELKNVSEQGHEGVPPPAERHISDLIPENGSDVFIHYIPNNDAKDPANQGQPRPTSFTWLPPNTQTPPLSPTRQKARALPIFTSDSRIPFGAPSTGATKNEGVILGMKPVRFNQEVKGTLETRRDLWEVPATPRD